MEHTISYSLRDRSQIRPWDVVECRKALFNRMYHELNGGDSVEKPFECSVCNKKFMKKNNLKTHQIVHRKQNIWCCTECPEFFEYKEYLDGN